MPSLADLQRDVHHALTSGEVTSLKSVLIGGHSPLHRLAIHQRHYEASLVKALLEKFPATAWLIGSEAVAHAARAFVRAHPPARPCIAEYGSDFPAFLTAHLSGAMPPYVQSFGELEWAVAHASIAISEPAVAWSDLVAIDANALPGTVLRLQPGVRYLHAVHAVDELLKIYLVGSEPEQFTLADGDAWIQVRGARGDVAFARLDAATFVFRTAVLAGLPLGDVVEQA
ncbi:MAG: HvfC/BufC family peptide modification chaperone, partial [Vicinamibacterales bacterium]